MIIASVGQKGGVGKSTIAIALASEGVARGLRVLLVDSDRQGTSRTWAATATEHQHPVPTVIAMDATMHRSGQLDVLAKNYDLVLIDCPARIGEVTASALMVADVALLPTGPSGADTWALAETLDLVRKAQTLRPNLRAWLAINKQTHTALGRGVREALADVGIPVLQTELHTRIAYQEAINVGLGIAQYASKDSAASEIKKLFNELLGVQTHGKTKRRKQTKTSTSDPLARSSTS